MLRISLRRVVNAQSLLNVTVRGNGITPTASSSSTLLHRHHVVSYVFSSQRRCFFSSLFSSTKKSPEIDPIKEENSKRTPMSAAGEKLLYEGPQTFQIRMMFGVGCVNVLYWTYYMSTCYLYKDVVHHGIAFGGDPSWGYIGMAGTVIIFYCTREYSQHAAYYAYETADGKRLGFQLHTMLGFPGRKIEASIGNVRLANTMSSGMGSSFIPLRVEGVGKNVLIDRDCTYYANGRLMELLKVGNSSRGGVRSNDGEGKTMISSRMLDSKEHRIEWKKQQISKRKGGVRS